MEQKSGHYGRLGLMVLLSFVAMYVLMYAMVDRLDHVFMNINKAYMAALMTAPMVAIELVLMGSMYPRRKPMIPHHSSAILMCREASLSDPGIVDLCRRIIANQESEIAEMKEKLGKLAAR
jgi:hypothetical protein